MSVVRPTDLNGAMPVRARRPMLMHLTRIVTRSLGALATVLVVLIGAAPCRAVVVSGRPMERPADGWVGSFNGSSCVAVGHCSGL